MYEHRSHPPLTPRAFVLRLLGHFLLAVAFVGLSLGVGMVGYLHFEPKVTTWRDAFLNAAMLLGGMGPVHSPQTEDGKLFAGLYALYAGLVFVVAAGLLFAPVVHRLLHRFHWDESVRVATRHSKPPPHE
jgi:protein-S-isoprenylcysteine O-methyltransferase Ste14